MKAERGTMSASGLEDSNENLGNGSLMGLVDRLQLRFANTVANIVLRAEAVNKRSTSYHTVMTVHVGYLRGGGKVVSVYAALIVMFCAYSCRILVVPLWTAKFIPVVSPVYQQHIHWLSSRQHTIAILLHVTTGIVCLLVGLFQFNSRLRSRFRAVHRWVGRLYALCGVVCLYSLWQLQGVVGKGPGSVPSLLLQTFTIICICWWTVATATAVYYVLKGNYDNHKKWMIRSYWILTTPMVQRVANLTLSFILYWVVAAYALAVDVISCSGPVANALNSIGHGDKQTQDELRTCLLSSVPAWPANHVSMLSLDGFGYTEYLVFGASAWLALVLVLYLSEVSVASTSIETTNSDDNAAIEMRIDASGSDQTQAANGSNFRYNPVSRLEDNNIDAIEKA
jgi:hypothetical protein